MESCNAMKPSEIKKRIEEAKVKLDQFLKDYKAVQDKYKEEDVLLDDTNFGLVFYHIKDVSIEKDKLKFYDSDLEKDVENTLVDSNWLNCPDDQPTEVWYNEEVEDWIKYWRKQLKAYEKFMNE